MEDKGNADRVGKDVLDALSKVLNYLQFKAEAERVSGSFKACKGVEEARAFLEQSAVR